MYFSAVYDKIREFLILDIKNKKEYTLYSIIAYLHTLKSTQNTKQLSKHPDVSNLRFLSGGSKAFEFYGMTVF